jgi:hypothetical protein
VGVEEDSVGVVVELGGDILDEELDLVDGTSVALGTLEGGGLLWLLIEGSGPLADISGFNAGNVELSAEGVLGLEFLVSLDVVEEVLEGDEGKVSVFLVNLSEDGGRDTGNGSLVNLVIGGLGSDFLSELGASGEGENVGVVREEENLLLGGGLVVGHGSDADNVTSADWGELQLEGEDVPWASTGGILKAELVGVLIELEDLRDLGNDVEVTLLSSSLVEGNEHVGWDHVVLVEVLGRPLADVGKGGSLALLEAVVLAREWDSGVVVALRGEKSPGAVVEDVSIELAATVVEAEGSSVDTDDVTEAGDNGEIFESLGVEDEGSVVRSVTGALLGLDVEGGIDDLEGADVSVLVGLVGECGIDNNTIDVLGLWGSDWSLSELRVLVL